MKRLFAVLCGLALLSVILSLPQAAAGETRTEGPLSYDITKEVTLSATVSSVLTKAAPGMMMGSHLLLSTVSGPVDANLGAFPLQGKGALRIAAGQEIEVTGVMKTIKDKQVFLTRTVKVGGEVYNIRNEHGFPLSPNARALAGRKSTGEVL
jgi:hypothetical protein